MKRLRPFFGYYGSKYRLAPNYPKPLHTAIVEPFAGSAGYSLLYPDHAVTLVDVDPVIIGVWDYLIKAKSAEIVALPDLEIGQDIDTLTVSAEAKALIGFWVAKGRAQPGRSLGRWAEDYPGSSWWGSKIKQRIITQQPAIRHWQTRCCSYSELDIGGSCTWFVDPPYNNRAGSVYKHHAIDYNHLSSWCRQRVGQLIVCENLGASWLPFKFLTQLRGVTRKSIEVVYAT